jgi:hypothetical protein
MDNKEKNELIIRLTPKKKGLQGLIATIFYIGLVWCTYKAHTQPPDSFVTKSYWAICYFLGPIYSLVFPLLILYILNLKCIEIYNSKIIQKVAVKWLPPFETVLQFRLNELKFRVFDKSYGSYTIVFYNSNKDIYVFLLLGVLFLSILYKKVINIRINPSFGLISDEKSSMLKLIDILIENCKRKEDKERLEKLRKEVLAWKNK